MYHLIHPRTPRACENVGPPQVLSRGRCYHLVCVFWTLMLVIGLVFLYALVIRELGDKLEYLASRKNLVF